MSSVSRYNPFATPQLTPQNTNASGNSRMLGAIPQTTSTASRQADILPPFNSIPDEAPPPYTPSADTLEDGIPVQTGLSLPFQAPRSPPITQPVITVADSPSEPRNISSPPPPPRRHSSVNSAPTEASRPGLSPTGARLRQSSSSYLPPPGPPPLSNMSDRGHTYSPPPGPPPRSAPSASAPNRLTDIPRGRDEEGRPTTTPVPGHPLLRGNKLLVYPPGYECSQCKNVGYRNNDPSHPCNKCWNKYARSYSGALAYAPFPVQSQPGASNFQRPLPKLQAPHTFTGSQSDSGPSRSPTTTQRPVGQARLRRKSESTKPNDQQSTRASVYSHSRAASTSGSAISPSPRINTSIPPTSHTPRQSQAQFSPRPVLTRQTSCGISRSAPPSSPPQVQLSPGQTLVLRAGDPRLGGRMCWRCDGRGYVSYLFFDHSTCEVCNGIGRTFN